MADNKQSFFEFGNMPPTPDFVQLRSADNDKKEPPPHDKNTPKKHEKARPQGKGFDLLRMLNLGNLTMDSDRTIIFAVIFLLMGEGSDELLLLALIYIML